MRLSAERSSPFYRAALVLWATVYVDGMTTPPCVEASESEGWADVIVCDDAGRYVLTPDRQSVAIERWRGRVQIVLDADR